MENPVLKCGGWGQGFWVTVKCWHRRWTYLTRTRAVLGGSEFPITGGNHTLQKGVGSWPLRPPPAAGLCLHNSSAPVAWHIGERWWAGEPENGPLGEQITETGSSLLQPLLSAL